MNSKLGMGDVKENPNHPQTQARIEKLKIRIMMKSENYLINCSKLFQFGMNTYNHVKSYKIIIEKDELSLKSQFNKY
jgi:hypothetical protein